MLTEPGRVAMAAAAPALLALLAVLCWPVRDRSGGASSVTRGAAGPGSPGGRSVRLRLAWSRAHAPPWRRARHDSWVADFAEVVAVGLEAGLDLRTAAVTSAQSPGVAVAVPWLADDLRRCVGSGREITTVLESAARVEPVDRADLRLLVAAWRLTEGAGAAAATVTGAAAASIRERRAAADRTEVLLAGPRASMVLLSALPLAGPLGALFLGMPPGRLYDSLASRVLASAGVLLTGAGWCWARLLLRRARRPGRTDGSVG